MQYTNIWKVPKSKDKYRGFHFVFDYTRTFKGLKICKSSITTLHVQITEARERWIKTQRQSKGASKPLRQGKVGGDGEGGSWKYKHKYQHQVCSDCVWCHTPICCKVPNTKTKTSMTGCFFPPPSFDSFRSCGCSDCVWCHTPICFTHQHVAKSQTQRQIPWWRVASASRHLLSIAFAPAATTQLL